MNEDVVLSLSKDSSVLEQSLQGERRTTHAGPTPRPGKEESHVTGSQAPPALLVFFQ